MRCGASATYMRLELAQPLDLDASIAQMAGCRVFHDDYAEGLGKREPTPERRVH